MRRAWAAALGCVLMMVAVVATALARDAPIVLLLVDGNGGALVPRLTAELEGLGFAVVRGPSTGGSLASMAKARGAQAAVRVPRSRRALSVWVTDPERTRDTARETEITGDGVGDDVFTVRSVELLRAAFLEIDVAMPTPPAKSAATSASASAPSAASAAPPLASSSAPALSAPPAASSAPTDDRVGPPRAPEPVRHRLAISGAVSVTPGGVPSQGHVIVGAQKAMGSAWWAAAWLTTPGIGGPLGAAEGEADMRTTYAGLELARELSLGRLRASLAAGAGGVWLRASGRGANSGVAGRVDDAVVPWVFARAGASWIATARVALAVDLRAGVTPSVTRVAFAGREVATFGQPILLPGLGVEVGLD